MKAMIFAAGLGTRLFPLTSDKPKALVEIKGKTLLEIVILKLINSGASEIVVNVHHFAEQVKQFLKTNQNFGANIYISDESACLLDTGGGLKKAAALLEGREPFILHNVDILSDLDLIQLYQGHMNRSKEAIATLLVNNRASNRVFLCDKYGSLRGWKNKSAGKSIIPLPVEGLSEVSFCGIHIINNDLLRKISQQGVFSMVDVYLELCKTEKIHCQVNNEAKWMDVGTLENLQQAEKLFY